MEIEGKRNRQSLLLYNLGYNSVTVLHYLIMGLWWIVKTIWKALYYGFVWLIKAMRFIVVWICYLRYV